MQYGDYLYYCQVDEDEDGTYDYVAITGCDQSVTEVEIPAEIDGLPVTSIMDGAFYCCYRLKSITIPDSITLIGDNVFDICNDLTSINVSENNENYCIIDGVLFNKDKTELIRYLPCNTNSEYIIPKGVTSIRGGAFNHCNYYLTSVTIPDGVTSIGCNAFDYCPNLENISIPNSVTSIGSYAFDQCLKLTSITIPDGVTSIEAGVFYFCDSLESITIPDSVISIEEHAFDGCESLTSIEVPDNVTSIGSLAFYNCSSLTSITIKNHECYIEDRYNGATISNGQDDEYNPYFNGTIYGYENSTAQEYAENYGTNFVSLGSYYLKYLTYEKLDSDNDGANDSISITGCDRTITEIEIPSEIDGLPVTLIGESAFAICESLTSINLPDGIEEIDDNAFTGCRSLTNINIPDSVKYISNYAFANCESLTSINIPDSVESIYWCAFNGCTNLASITIKNPECKIIDDEQTISDTATIYGYVGSTAQEYAEKYNREFAALKAYSDEMQYGDYLSYKQVDEDGDGTYDYAEISDCDRTVTEIEIPAEIDGLPVKTIGKGAFSWCEELTDVTIPESVCGIGEYAFGDPLIQTGDDGRNGLNNLKNVNIQGNGLKYIGYNAFAGDVSLKEINLPDSVETIGYGAFSRSGIINIEIPESVTIINCTFYMCKELESITISEGVTSIRNDAFYDCTNLISITILNPECDIDDYAGTICNGYYPDNYYFNGTIYGYENSTAQAYAEKYNRKFAVIGSGQEEIQGDANGDGVLNIRDAAFIARKLAERKASELSKWADYNGDGVVNIRDAAAIARYLANSHK